ncbi:Isochorismatase hydrolase [Bimuria novae-zelandiae CBS 107.79]|uniref:Isochorismatase hydrolase n=1 Tax=Bimuria novae-zelandiae CBS 107.79 TaxID=1447943 RepID=A0A6A5V8C3_9PLEO|nr:Isochorismatase hydrolase [Bimuria novae-zelandiae CBS 107.79]
MRPSSLITILSLAFSGACNPSLQPRVSSDWNPFERISQNDSALLIVDHQVGLFQLTRDWDQTLFYQNMIAHAALGTLFNLPVVITTSAQTGPNGPLPKEILDMYPDVTPVLRNGEVDAWDSPEFRAAVRATGKKQLIIAGIVTDVCTTFLALSLRSEGYSVYANIEASGTTTPLIRDTANLRMQAAGVHLVSLFAVLGDLMRDWRNPSPGIEAVVPFINRYLPAYGLLARGHASAILQNGTVLPGIEQFI